MALHYFKDVLHFPVRPNPTGHEQRVGEFEIARPDLSKPIFCEVKTPIRDASKGEVWSGNDSDAIKGVLKQAYGQIPRDDRPTMVILTAKLRTPVSHQSSGIIEAVYGEGVLAGEFNPETGSASDFKSSYIRNGFFQPGKNRHLGVVVTLEAWLGSPRMDSMLRAATRADVDLSLPMHDFEYVLKVYHNPYALKPIPLQLFKGYQQCSFDYCGRRLIRFE